MLRDFLDISIEMFYDWPWGTVSLLTQISAVLAIPVLIAIIMMRGWHINGEMPIFIFFICWFS